jgi:hypothetical protein
MTAVAVSKLLGISQPAVTRAAYRGRPSLPPMALNWLRDKTLKYMAQQFPRGHGLNTTPVKSSVLSEKSPCKY